MMTLNAAECIVYHPVVDVSLLCMVSAAVLQCNNERGEHRVLNVMMMKIKSSLFEWERYRMRM